MKKNFALTSLWLAVALLLSACGNQAAAPENVNWWPWNFWNSTLEATLARECNGLPAGSSVPVNGAQVPCPTGQTITIVGTFDDPTPAPETEGWCDPSTIHPIVDLELDPTVGLTIKAGGETHIEWYIPNQTPDEGIVRVLPGQAVTVLPGVRGHYWTFAAGVRPACMQADWEQGLKNYLAKSQHIGLVAADVVIFPKGELITITDPLSP